jgi:peroxiredoxin
MRIPKKPAFLWFVPVILACLSSCNQEFKNDDYTAYFGGEVLNPVNPYVLFCKDSKVIDTIPLKENNTFFIKFDSLTPGLYTFKHEPEYQYIYFDKNDSIMVHINSKNFDESIVFCGRGDEKNNFLMEMYLKNERDKSDIFEIFDYDVTKFNKNIDSIYAISQKFYETKKETIQWSDSFDVFAKASLDFQYFSKKELFPLVHKLRTGNNIYEKLPKNYYAYRNKIDFNNYELTNYSPFVSYLSYLLNNMGAITFHNHYSGVDLALKTNINKLNIADTLIKNEKVKNIILDNIAFTYFLEDQNVINNQTFLDTYYKYSTNKSKENEIIKIGKAIQLLKVGNPLPEVTLMDTNGTKISSNALKDYNTVLFFWTANANSHLLAAHKKVLELKSKYPNYQFIAINLDKDQNKWKEELNKYKFNGIIELRSADFEDLKTKWAIMKVHRTIIINEDGTIKNAFTNLFNSDFETVLQ